MRAERVLMLNNFRATYKDGKLFGPLKKSAGVKGTTIRAENLFYENKTRRDAINRNTEIKKIVKIVTNYALFNTGVSLTLKKVGHQIFNIN